MNEIMEIVATLRAITAQIEPLKTSARLDEIQQEQIAQTEIWLNAIAAGLIALNEPKE